MYFPSKNFVFLQFFRRTKKYFITFWLLLLPSMLHIPTWVQRWHLIFSFLISQRIFIKMFSSMKCICLGSNIWDRKNFPCHFMNGYCSLFVLTYQSIMHIFQSIEKQQKRFKTKGYQQVKWGANNGCINVRVHLNGLNDFGSHHETKHYHYFNATKSNKKKCVKKSRIKCDWHFDASLRIF